MKISSVLLLILTLISGGSISNSGNSHEQYEKRYFDIGYKEVEKALEESEKYFSEDIKLPTQLPPVNFTHSIGRLNKSEEKVNNELEIKYLNENLGENHYKIIIRPIQYKLPYSKEKIEQTLKLNNGKEAIYGTIEGFNILVFETDKWQYTLCIDKRLSDKVTPQILVDIANSVY